MIASRRSRFLELKELSALAHMRFTTRHRIEGVYGGRHRSRQRGGAGEFLDHREYVEGDDVRHLDWKVLARTGRAYLRTYQEETNLNCMMMIDISNSMRFTEDRSASKHPSKLEYAQFMGTALSHIITQQQDQVGLGLIGGGLVDLVMPGSTPGHAVHIQERIEAIETQDSTDLGNGLAAAFTRLTKRGVMLLLSDFLVHDLEEVFSALRLFRHRHWDIVVLHLVHPLEERLPAGLAFQFIGLEGEEAIDCSPHQIASAYEDKFQAHCELVRSFSLATACDYHRVSTAEPYLLILGKFLVERSA